MQHVRFLSLMFVSSIAKHQVHRSTVVARSMSQERKHVAVIGAGYAGLAAARTLLASSAVEVTLLEATDRVGGRAATGLLPFSECPVELGATWFHGTQQNPVYDLAVEYGVVPSNNKVTAAAAAAPAAAPAAARDDAHSDVKTDGVQSPIAAEAVEKDADINTAAAAAVPAASMTSTAASSSGAAAVDVTANAAGGSSSSSGDADPRWEVLLCAPTAAAPLQGQQKVMALEAFQLYSSVLADVEDVLMQRSSTAAGAAAAGEAAALCGGGAGLESVLPQQQQQQQQSAAAGERSSSLGSLLRQRFDAVMSPVDHTAAAAAAAAGGEQKEPRMGGEFEQLAAVLAESIELKQAFVDGWACRERLQRAYDGFDSTDAAGVTHALEYVDLDGPNMPVPGGYQDLAEMLAADVVRLGLNLSLNSAVRRIHWDRADGKVGVEVAGNRPASAAAAAAAGSSNPIYVYDAVVFTCSLGVLKNQSADMFEPKLPADKSLAIQQLQIGQIEKLFVEWPAAAAAIDEQQQAEPGCSSTNGSLVQQGQQQRDASATVLVGTGSNLVGPRKPKTQLHDYQVQYITDVSKNTASAQQNEDTGFDNSSSSSNSATFTTYCLLWPSKGEFWGTAWQQQQQATGSSNADSDPIYINCLSSSTQQQLPQWLLGVHSWRYGDGPEWIKAAAGSSVKQHQQQHASSPERSAVVWVTGLAARHLANLNDEQVLQHLGQVLQLFPTIPQPERTTTATPDAAAAAAASNEFFCNVDVTEAGSKQITNPLSSCKLLRSTWCSSKYYQGSYSYPGPQATGETADTLAAPLTAAAAAAGSSAGAAVVCFAGEATSRQHMGTVHGAYLSGVREAERLLQQWGL